MKLLRTVDDLKKWRRKEAGSTVGFVPTMGALHEGHRCLIEASCAENSVTLVSIYVNQAQFNDQRDCENYPTPLKEDLRICEEEGVDAVFLPKKEDLYPDQYCYRVEEQEESLMLEGESRPGHFTGVLTVVMKLLLLAKADKAYFGEKDWQQFKLVNGMVKAFFLDTVIVPVPTVRESNGLAMSSRNERLSEAGRILAPELYRVISTAIDCDMARHELRALGFQVEYVDEKDGRRLAAAQVDGVRLIDNVAVGV